jgi:hypothetical protein
MFAAFVWLCSIGAAILGMVLHEKVADRHLDAASCEVVKLVIALIATMSALVLSLLISSANTSYDRQVSQLQALSANVILLDQTLDLYGPEAKPVRDGLRSAVQHIHDRVWNHGSVQLADLVSLQTQDSVKANLELLQTLTPKTDFQRRMQISAMEQMESLAQGRLQMFESLGGSIAGPFLTVLVFWISTLFLGFGLLTRNNGTVTVALVLGGLSVAGAIFLILEMNNPYSGVMRISDEPLLKALAVLGS